MTDACRRIVSRDSSPKFTKFGEHIMCRLSNPRNAAEYCRALTRRVRDIRYQRFLHRKKWTKVHVNTLRPDTHQCPSLCQISSLSVKRCTRNALIFLHTSVFRHPKGTPESSSNSGNKRLLHGQSSNAAKFRRAPT